MLFLPNNEKNDSIEEGFDFSRSCFKLIWVTIQMKKKGQALYFISQVAENHFFVLSDVDHFGIGARLSSFPMFRRLW
jgi:hypothetical protein